MPRCCEGVNRCDDTVPVKGRGEVSGGGGGMGQILLFIRLREPPCNRRTFHACHVACIMFPSSHAAVGAYPRLDAVSSIIASSHSLIFLLLTSFSPESAVAASVSRSLSLSGDPCVPIKHKLCVFSSVPKQLLVLQTSMSILLPRRLFTVCASPQLKGGAR